MIWIPAVLGLAAGGLGYWWISSQTSSSAMSTGGLQPLQIIAIIAVAVVLSIVIWKVF